MANDTTSTNATPAPADARYVLDRIQAVPALIGKHRDFLNDFKRMKSTWMRPRTPTAQSPA